MTSDRICLLVRECQIFAGQSACASGGAGRRRLLVHEFVTRLPEPEQPLEKVFFSWLLFDVALRWSRDVHRQYHQRHASDCSFDPTVDVPQDWQNRDASPVTVFGTWVAAFLDAFEPAHGLSAAVRVKEMIDAENGPRLTVTFLSRSTGCHPVRLRYEFKITFGISIREYQTRCRVVQAARLLGQSDLKVDAVAHSVGFRSRKNFYDAFRRLVGAAPSAVRGWSAGDLENLERRLLPLSPAFAKATARKDVA